MYNVNAPAGEQFSPAEYCGNIKQAKAKNPNYADEAIQYESFCPEHMHKWMEMRKERARNEVNEDDNDWGV